MAKHLVQHKSPGTPLTEPSPTGSFEKGLGKKQVAALADQSVGQLLEDGNVFQVAEALAAMEEFVKTVRKDERYIQYLRDELAKHQGRLITASGARIESCETGVTYDYSHHGEWKTLSDDIRELEERKKQVEERLRSIGPGRIAVDEETGEVFEGARKRSRSTYRITLSK